MDVDLILLDVAADAGHFGHALDRLQLITHVPVLHAAQLPQVSAVRFERVPIDLAQRRGVRAKLRHDARRQFARGVVHPLQHTRPAPVVVVLVVKDHEHHREAEAGHRPDRLDAGRALQADRQRIGDLVLDVLRRPSRPLHHHDDLLFADVGNRIDRCIDQAVVADAQHDGREEEDQKAVVEAPADQTFNHLHLPASFSRFVINSDIGVGAYGVRASPGTCLGCSGVHPCSRDNRSRLVGLVRRPSARSHRPQHLAGYGADMLPFGGCPIFWRKLLQFGPHLVHI